MPARKAMFILFGLPLPGGLKLVPADNHREGDAAVIT
jgi:hypothetical protein